MKHLIRALAFAVGLSCAIPAAWADKGDAFQPQQAATVNLAAGTVSSNVALAITGQFRVFNSGSVVVFINVCPTNTCAASISTGLPIAPGTIEVFTAVGQYVAGITASGSATIYLTHGAGI